MWADQLLISTSTRPPGTGLPTEIRAPNAPWSRSSTRKAWAGQVGSLAVSSTPGARSAGMPWRTFAGMTDDELHALWLYLRAVPAGPFGHK